MLSVREYFKDKDQAEYEAYLAAHPVQEVAAEEVAADKDDEMESWGDVHDGEQGTEQDRQARRVVSSAATTKRGGTNNRSTAFLFLPTPIP